MGRVEHLVLETTTGSGSGDMVLHWGDLSPGDTWQCLETFTIVTTWQVFGHLVGEAGGAVTMLGKAAPEHRAV